MGHPHEIWRTRVSVTHSFAGEGVRATTIHVLLYGFGGAGSRSQ
jgi:hypothetical protein